MKINARGKIKQVIYSAFPKLYWSEQAYYFVGNPLPSTACIQKSARVEVYRRKNASAVNTPVWPVPRPAKQHRQRLRLPFSCCLPPPLNGRHVQHRWWTWTARDHARTQSHSVCSLASDFCCSMLFVGFIHVCVLVVDAFLLLCSNPTCESIINHPLYLRGTWVVSSLGLWHRFAFILKNRSKHQKHQPKLVFKWTILKLANDLLC